MVKSWLWDDAVDITVDPADCIGHLSTKLLEKELIDRMDEKINDPKKFIKDENKRGGEFSILIDPDEYDLIDKDDVSISDFTEEQIVDHLERNSKEYTIVSRTETFGSIDNVIRYLQNLPKYKMRDFLCDVLSITRRSSDEDIIKELKAKI